MTFEIGNKNPYANRYSNVIAFVFVKIKFNLKHIQISSGQWRINFNIKKQFLKKQKQNLKIFSSKIKLFERYLNYIGSKILHIHS